MPKEKKKSNLLKLELGVSIAVIAVLVIIVAVLFIGQQAPAGQTKTVSVPTEIKSQPEAASLEKDTSSILGEINDALTNIDASLPEV